MLITVLMAGLLGLLVKMCEQEFCLYYGLFIYAFGIAALFFSLWMGGR